MRPTRLVLSGFMSWTDLDLDLSAVDVVGVTGRVGNGKSALLDALLWCLFGEGRASGDALIRQGEPRCRVEVEGEVSGRPVRVRRERERGKATALTLEVEGRAETRHTVPETQAAIVDLLGVTPGALLATAVMVQGRSDEFWRLRPGERMALLASLVVTEPYAEWHERAKAGRDAAREATAQAEGRAAALAEEAHAAGSLREAATRLSSAAERARAEAERSALAASSAARAAREIVEGDGSAAQRRRSLLARLSAVADERAEWTSAADADGLVLAVPIPEMPVRTVEREQVEAAERDARIAEGHAAERREVAVQVEAAEAEVRRLEATALDATGLPCRGEGPYAACPLLLAMPTRIDVDEAARTLRERESRLAGLSTLANSACALRTEADALVALWQDEQREAAATFGLIAAAKSGRGRAEEGIRRAEAALARLDAEEAGLCAELASIPEPDPDAARRAEDREAFAAAMAESAERDRQAAQALTERAAVAVRDAERAEKALEGWLAATVEVGVQSALAGRYAVLAEAWHPYGIPRQIVEEAIPQIEAHANEALSRLPGGFTLRLSTSREKRQGGTSDTLDVAVEADARERDYALLSGGERFRVDLAVRLGIAGLLAERTGRRWECLWLDEPLAPGDEQEREAVTQSIAALSDQYPLVVIVSHDAEFAEALPWALRVTKAGRSRAELVRQ